MAPDVRSGGDPNNGCITWDVLNDHGAGADNEIAANFSVLEYLRARADHCAFVNHNSPRNIGAGIDETSCADFCFMAHRASKINLRELLDANILRGDGAHTDDRSPFQLTCSSDIGCRVNKGGPSLLRQHSLKSRLASVAATRSRPVATSALGPLRGV